MTERVTPADIYDAADQAVRRVIIHRRTDLPKHSSDDECWCCPLVLEGWQMRAEARYLQLTLNEFYAVH